MWLHKILGSRLQYHSDLSTFWPVIFHMVLVWFIVVQSQRDCILFFTLFELLLYFQNPFIYDLVTKEVFNSILVIKPIYFPVSLCIITLFHSSDKHVPGP
jgi:hypothetical protein